MELLFAASLNFDAVQLGSPGATEIFNPDEARIFPNSAVHPGDALVRCEVEDDWHFPL